MVRFTLQSAPSRRSFVTGAASAAALLGLSACGGGATSAPASAEAVKDLAASGAATITMWLDAERARR